MVQYVTNKDSLYTIIWNQYCDCAPQNDPMDLLIHIKQVSLKFKNVMYKPAAVQDAQVASVSFYQAKQESLHQYYLKFKDLVDALDHYGMEVGIILCLSNMLLQSTVTKIPIIFTMTTHHTEDIYQWPKNNFLHNISSMGLTDPSMGTE